MPRDDDLALDEWLGREVDVGLWRLGDDASLGIQNLRAQHDEIHPALVARPFYDGGLVVFDRDARKRLGQRVGNLAR